MTAAEHHVRTTGPTAKVRRADQHIIQSVAVDVAGPCNGVAGFHVALAVSTDPEATVAKVPEVDRGATPERAEHHICRATAGREPRPEDHVLKAIAVHIPGRRHRLWPFAPHIQEAHKRHANRV